MKQPPLPLAPSGLAARAAGHLGHPLVIRCCAGWGWSVLSGGETMPVNDASLTNADIEVIPEAFIPFRSERGGIHGRVISPPAGHSFTRFLAFTMPDGTDYDFTNHAAAAWRVVLSDGVPDLDSHWFPLLTGDPCYLGYGMVALSAAHHDRFAGSCQDPLEGARKD